MRTLCLVTRVANYRDNDRMLTLISQDFGKLSALSRGCRKTGGKLLACSQIFCYGEYMFYEKNERLGVMSCDIHKSFFGVSRDIETFSSASAIIRMCEKASGENQPEPRLFSLAVHSLNYLESAAVTPKDMHTFALIKICDILGYRPRFDFCPVCGKPLRAPCYLDAVSDGLTCGACVSGVGKNPLNGYDVKLIAEVFSCPNRALGGIKPGNNLSGNLLAAFDDYLSYHLS